jgi:hypothetical protein
MARLIWSCNYRTRHKGQEKRKHETKAGSSRRRRQGERRRQREEHLTRGLDEHTWKNWMRKGADRLRQKTLLFVTAWLATSSSASTDTYTPHHAMYQHIIHITQLHASPQTNTALPPSPLVVVSYGEEEGGDVEVLCLVDHGLRLVLG